MKSKNQVVSEISKNKGLLKLKEAFRKWYASLSVRELVQNQALASEIEAFERLLSRKEPVSC